MICPAARSRVWQTLAGSQPSPCPGCCFSHCLRQSPREGRDYHVFKTFPHLPEAGSGLEKGAPSAAERTRISTSLQEPIVSWCRGGCRQLSFPECPAFFLISSHLIFTQTLQGMENCAHFQMRTCQSGKL